MKYFFHLCLLLIFISCADSPKKTMSKSWHGSMRGLADSLTSIMPQLVTADSHLSSKDESKLKRAINDLQIYSENLSSDAMMVPSQDPSLKFVAFDFQQELKRIKKESKSGDLVQAQKDLKGLTRYCVSCHTKTTAGSSQFTEPMGQAVAELSDVDQGEFYMAMRQFEKALVHLETGLTNRDWAQKHPNQWNHAAMQLLAVTVRVHDNPRLTLEMISRLFDTKAYPRQLEQAAYEWRRDAKEWSEKGKKSASLEGLPEMLKKAKAKDKKVPHSGLILNLRAQSRLNRYLQAGGLSATSEQAVLYYSGMVEERLNYLNFSGFPKAYFKACIEVNPQSKFAKLCKNQF